MLISSFFQAGYFNKIKVVTTVHMGLDTKMW